MDDMIGEPEREDAAVIPIHSHPEYRCFIPPEIQIGSDDQQGFDDGVTEDMIAILEEAGVGRILEERNLIGNNVCWLCTHRVDRRPWWKRLLFTANESSYLCDFVRRTEVADPVSGQPRYVERVTGPLGPQAILVDTPHRPCNELNPDGECPTFNIALVEKKRKLRKD